MNKVSVVMCSYNSSKFISDSILSIINQTYLNWELIITDDCSTDNTVNLIKNLMEFEKRVKLYQLDRNQGAGSARNNSISKSTGRYIAFCDSDDMWKPTKLEKQISFMKENKLPFSFSSYDCINEDGKFIKTIHAPVRLSYSKIIKNNYIGCLTAIYDQKSLGKLYMPLIRKRQDWVLWIKILENIKNTSGLSESLAIYRISKNSISSNKIFLIKYNWLVYRRELKFSYVKSLYMIFIFAYYYIKKQAI